MYFKAEPSLQSRQQGWGGVDPADRAEHPGNGRAVLDRACVGFVGRPGGATALEGGTHSTETCRELKTEAHTIKAFKKMF